MNKKWKVGIFAPNSKDYLEYAQGFIIKLISDKNENIIKTRKSYFDFEIETDKSIYIFKTLADNIRGLKLHEVFIFDSDVMDGENIEYITARIFPYNFDNVEKGYFNKYTHYINKKNEEIPSMIYVCYFSTPCDNSEIILVTQNKEKAINNVLNSKANTLQLWYNEELIDEYNLWKPSKDEGCKQTTKEDLEEWIKCKQIN